MKQPRFMLAAPSSGSGKTMITCGILQILKNRGYRVSSFKCGPDYIDPMFHTKVLGTISRNLDTFFTGEEMTRCLFAKTAQQTDLSVIDKQHVCLFKRQNRLFVPFQLFYISCTEAAPENDHIVIREPFSADIFLWYALTV